MINEEKSGQQKHQVCAVSSIWCRRWGCQMERAGGSWEPVERRLELGMPPYPAGLQSRRGTPPIAPLGMGLSLHFLIVYFETLKF